MEVAVPVPSQNQLDNFDFNSSAMSSPHLSPRPSTPKRFGDFYFSAPTSPNHLSHHFYRDYDDLFVGGGPAVFSGAAVAALPFGWEGEQKSSSPSKTDNRGEYDFAFDVSEDREKASLSADELFDGGAIKLLKPPAAAGIGENAASSRKSPAAVTRSPISQIRKIFHGALSPRHRNKEESGPFAAAAQNAARSEEAASPLRGRERGINMQISFSRRAARSLSPIRDAQFPWEEEKDEQPSGDPTNSTPSAVCSALSVPLRGHKKWRLKDFFLFRSASDGRAADKDPLKKYTSAFRHSSDGSGSGSGLRKRRLVSAHELHYTANRAVSEDLKKKTFLPYKQGILGRLAFNPAAHALANGFGFSRK